jgi:hypothetical protein
VHKTSYQLFRGVHDGTKWSRSPHCLQCVKEVVSCRNFNSVRVCPGHRVPGHRSRWSEEWNSETPTVQYIIYNIKNDQIRIMLNIDGDPITSKSHTHPSHSQTSRLLIPRLYLWVFQFPHQPSVWEEGRFLTFSFQSFITPTLWNRFSFLALALSQTRVPVLSRETDVRDEVRETFRCFFNDLWRLNGDRPRGSPSKEYLERGRTHDLLVVSYVTSYDVSNNNGTRFWTTSTSVGPCWYH